jgi:hypothetical protein
MMLETISITIFAPDCGDSEGEAMADFGDEAKEILKSERERAAENAKYGAGWAILMTGLLWLWWTASLAWHGIQSVFFGARFPWRDLWVDIGCFVAVFVIAWIYYRLNAPREASDARLIRIELKLDRLLDSSDEMPERLKENINEERDESPTREENWRAYLGADQRIRERNRDGG